jgi:hypothetical protein
MIPQLSVTSGGMNEEVGFGGLQPNDGITELPVRTGFTRSVVQEIVWTNGLLSLPHASTKIHVLVCVFSHPAAVIELVTG